MTKRLAVVREADADFATSTELADRVLMEEISWLDGSLMDSQRACWQVTPLEKLRATGKNNGLSAYLKEIQTRLAPLITSN